MEIDPFIKNLPKVELHVHIEGTLTPELRWELACKNGIELPFDNLQSLKTSYSTWSTSGDRLGAQGLAIFLEQYFGGMTVLRTASDFYELAMDYFRKAHFMNIWHAEVFFDPQAHTRRGVPVTEVIAGLEQARREALRKFGITCSFILCFLREMSVESAEEAYEACSPYFHKVISGIGLDGNEHDRPPMLFEKLFRRARNDGLRVTSHCDVGQKNTHEHIRQVVSSIMSKGLDRIDHGLNAHDRPELVDIIKKRGLTMTLCPFAYHRRWPDDRVFPVIRSLFDQGVKITINSDDPTYMQNFWLEDNIQLLRDRCGFSDAEIVRLVRNAIDGSWAADERKDELHRELDAYQGSFSGKPLE